MVQKDKWQKLDRETTVFILFLTVMAVYYCWRMFALTPWYDELYTYYFFVSRGPLYAAIHWPLPNNHIGYSVLSACLNIFGNAAVSLRGVSYLCSLGNLVLLFKIGRKCFDRRMALIPVFCYAGMKVVNQLAVQGRGYALVTFCYLVALNEFLLIATKSSVSKKHYIVFGLSLVMALYAIPSSVYVVVPVCLIGGMTLLVHKEYRRLFRLILTSVLSAVCTVGLYGIVWFAIGSNLLAKTEGSDYYGMGHFAILSHAPFRALKTGIDYMLATPYIQSVEREGFPGRFADWLQSLLNEYYTGGTTVLAVILIVGAILAVVRILSKIRNYSYIQTPAEKSAVYDDFVEFYLAGSILCIPVMLMIQRALPYYRVFSFAGVVAAIAVTWLWQMLMRQFVKLNEYAEKKKDAESTSKHIKLEKYMPAAGCLICGIFCALKPFTPSYMVQYSAREAAIEDAYEHTDVSHAEKIAVTDCDQEYLLLFLYGIEDERVTRQPEEGDIVLADKFLLLGELNREDPRGDMWKLYLTQEQFEESGVREQMEEIYRNTRFTLYKRKENE